MIDTRDVIRDYALSLSSVTDVIGQKFFMTTVIAEGDSPPCVSCQRLGGPGLHTDIGGLVEPIMSFKAWGLTPIGAESVYTVMGDAFEDLKDAPTTVGSRVIKSAVEVLAPQDFPDLDSEYHFVNFGWRFKII